MSLPAPLPLSGELVAGLRPVERVAAAWLVEYRGHTRAAYVRDLQAWSELCAERDGDLMAASRGMVAAYADYLLEAGLSAATVNRKLSALTGFYRRGVELGLIDTNPAEFVRRPKVSQEGVTPGLDRDELRRVLAAAAAGGLRASALVSLLALNALRVSEAVAADASDLSHERGHRTLMLTGKGGGRVRIPLAPRTCAAIDAYLADRESGPLFLSTHAPERGAGASLPSASLAIAPQSAAHSPELARLSRFAARRIVQRIARQAGVTKPIGAHSLRVAAITGALDAGASFRDVQDFARHADPRTTRRYDRNRDNLDRNATYQLTTWLAE